MLDKHFALLKRMGFETLTFEDFADKGMIHDMDGIGHWVPIRWYFSKNQFDLNSFYLINTLLNLGRFLRQIPVLLILNPTHLGVDTVATNASRVSLHSQW